jgi:hypothetical protein
MRLNQSRTYVLNPTSSVQISNFYRKLATVIIMPNALVEERVIPKKPAEVPPGSRLGEWFWYETSFIHEMQTHEAVQSRSYSLH